MRYPFSWTGLFSCRLLTAYTAIITLLAFHGPRIQTALQLPWGMDGVDVQEGSIRLNHSKNAAIRSVPMHPPVMDVLRPIWKKRGRPTKGHVFLNQFGEP